MTILQVLAIGLLTSTHLSVFGSYAATPDHLLAGMASGMRWHGKIFADGPEYEFYGDAQDILRKVLAINPNYKPLPIENPAINFTMVEENQKMLATMATPSDKAIPIKATNPGGILVCYAYANADGQNIPGHISYLKGLGASCSVAGHSCIRTVCGNSSGIYICNDDQAKLEMPCSTIADFASFIINDGCPCRSTKSNRLNGQLYSINNLWSIIVGYSDCNSAPERKPIEYGKYPGPSGVCA